MPDENKKAAPAVKEKIDDTKTTTDVGQTAAAPESGAPDAAAPAKERKSIVPAGWKTKNDALKQFIQAQAGGKDGFEYPAFFQLCRKNGIAEDQVKRYEDDIRQEKHGAKGRAIMTLRNMLDTIVRKNGKLVGLDGKETPIALAERALGGAAAANAAKKAAETEKAAA